MCGLIQTKLYVHKQRESLQYYFEIEKAELLEVSIPIDSLVKGPNKVQWLMQVWIGSGINYSSEDLEILDEAINRNDIQKITKKIDNNRY